MTPYISTHEKITLSSLHVFYNESVVLSGIRAQP